MHNEKNKDILSADVVVKPEILKQHYPEKLELESDTKLYRFADYKEGVDGNQHDVYFSKKPNDAYAANYLLETTVEKLKNSGADLRNDHTAMGDPDSVVAIYDEPPKSIPSDRVSNIVGFDATTHTIPVVENDNGHYTDLDGNLVDQRWVDKDGKVHFPDEK